MQYTFICFSEVKDRRLYRGSVLASISIKVSKKGSLRSAFMRAFRSWSSNFRIVSSTPVSVDCNKRIRPLTFKYGGALEINWSITCLPLMPPAQERPRRAVPAHGFQRGGPQPRRPREEHRLSDGQARKLVALARVRRHVQLQPIRPLDIEPPNDRKREARRF